MAQARVELLADSRQVRRATDDLRDLERRGKTTTTVTNQLRNAFVALGGALAVRELARLSDTYTGIQNRLKIVTDSTAQLTEVQGKLLQVANDSRAEFETTVGLYSTLARSTEELGLSQERLLRVTETINKAFAASGADAATAAGAIRQLGQGLAAGALRGDEFNSVAEGAPEIMRAIAAETGMTIGALREFAAEGKITSELLIRSLENYGDTVDDIFRNSERTIAQSFQEARNNAIQFIGGIEAVDDASQAFGDSIVALSENLDLVIDAATVLAAVFAGRVAGSIGTNVAAFTAAQIQAARYQATLASMAGVSRVTATSLGALSLAARGASAAMAFLGGPVGVVAIAAGALIYFSESAQTAEERARPLREEVDALRQSMQDLSETQLREEFNSLSREAFKVLPTNIRRVKAELDSLNESILERQQSVAAPGGPGTLSPALLRDIERAQELETRLESLTLEQAAAEEKAIALGDELVRLGESGKAAAEGVDEASAAASEGSKAFDSMAASLTEQIIELRDGAEAAEDFAIAQRLGADATEAERNAIAGLVTTLRQLRAERESGQLRGQAMQIGFDLAVGDDPIAQAEEQMFQRLSVIDNALAQEAITKEEWRALDLQAEQAYQERLTEISEQSAAIRNQVAEQEARQQFQSTQSMFSEIGTVFGNFAEIAKQGGEESFETYKLLASAQAAMSAAVAINRALAEGGPYLGPALAASIAALTGAQIVQINNQQFNPRAVGGQVIGGNQYLVGERGPEIVTMGSNGNVTPYNMLMNQARQGQAPQQNVRVIVENYGNSNATVREEMMNDERVIRVVVGSIKARKEVHKAITQTTSANNRIGGN